MKRLFAPGCALMIYKPHLAEKLPRYLIDLLFEENTVPKTYQPELWHKKLDEYTSSHT